MLARAVSEDPDLEPDLRSALLDNVSCVTAHSCRCTIVTALAAERSSGTTLALVGKWADPRMPLRYVRGKTVALDGVRRLARVLRARHRMRDDRGSSGEASARCSDTDPSSEDDPARAGNPSTTRSGGGMRTRPPRK